jgi:hypothetical protein
LALRTHSPCIILWSFRFLYVHFFGNQKFCIYTYIFTNDWGISLYLAKNQIDEKQRGLHYLNRMALWYNATLAS